MEKYIAPALSEKTGSDELFVVCVISDSNSKIEKATSHYLDAFLGSNLNYKSMRSRLVSHNNNNLN